MVQQEVKIFSLNKQRDWERGAGYNLELNDQGMTIAQTRKYSVQAHFRFEEVAGPSQIQDFTLGERKTLILLDQDASVWIYDYDNHYTERLLPPDHGMFTSCAMMASGRDTLVLADPWGEQRLSAYSVSNGQTLWEQDIWGENALYPLALASDRDGVFYVLVPLGEGTGEKSHLEADTSLAVLRIERSGRIDRVYRHPKLACKGEHQLRGEKKRSFFLTVGEGKLYVFDALYHTLYALTMETDEVAMLNLPSSIEYAGLAVDSSDYVFIGDRRDIDSEGEDDRHILCFAGMGQSITSLSGFRGRVDKLLADEDERLYALNIRDGGLAILELQQRTQVLEHTGLPEGVYYSKAFDSTSTETRWHKIVADVDIPDETQVRVSYYASDRADAVIDGEWTLLDDYIGNPDIHPYMKQYGLKSLWSEPIINPQDALLFKAEGRYLWLRIEMFGSEDKSPKLRRLRVHFPRSSYLEYLPAVYQQDEQSRDFLERYLSLLGTFMDETEETVQGISRYFDPEAMGGDYLRWLGTWMGIANDDRWTQSQLRALMREAPTLYKKRGTRQAIEAWVQLFTGEVPYIMEYHQWKNLDESAELKKAMAELYGKDPHCFCVLVKPECIHSEEQRSMLQKLIDEEKPAYTEAKLVVLQPWMYMDMHTYLGINTYLSEPTVLSLDDQSSLPYNTVIVDLNRDRRLDIHTRLELDSELE